MDDLIIGFELKRNGQAKIAIDGDVRELLAGVLTMTKSIYQQIQLNSGEDSAEWFLQQIGRAMVITDHPLYKEVREE